MKPPPFDYVAVHSLEEALSALAEGGDEAKILAGGQSLIPLMSLRLAHPALLVDVNKVDELTSVERRNGSLRVGALVRHRTAERSEQIASDVPLVAQAMPLIGHVAIRSRGTIGGSIAHADPAAELPAVALALGATLNVTSKARGERSIAAADFFQGYFTTSIEADEMLTSIDFPVLEGAGFAVEEVARRHGDFAMVGAVVATGAGGARIALLNVAEKPVRASAAEAALDGGASIEEAAALATDGLEPSADLHASTAYRKKVAGVCVRRALTRALEGTSK